MTHNTYELLCAAYALGGCIGGSVLINSAIGWRNLNTRRGRIQAWSGMGLLTSAIGAILLASA